MDAAPPGVVNSVFGVVGGGGGGGVVVAAGVDEVVREVVNSDKGIA